METLKVFVQSKAGSSLAKRIDNVSNISTWLSAVFSLICFRLYFSVYKDVDQDVTSNSALNFPPSSSKCF